MNDLNNPMATTLAPGAMAWLVRRAERPQDFLPDLAHGDIIARGEDCSTASCAWAPTCATA